jgi:antitoxin VapB
MLNIKNPEADELARILAKKTGKSITEVVILSLREQLRREEGRTSTSSLVEEIMEISRRCAALPVLDDRSEDEILGYNEHGHWS